MKKLLSTLLLVAIATTFSCNKKSSDTEKPNITFDTPLAMQEFAPGETIALKAKIEDNSALYSYKIDIHYGSGHSHQVAAQDTKADVAVAKWQYAKQYYVQGTSYNVEHNIVIPAEAEHGDYHIGLFCTDESGNEHIVYRTIVIEGAH